MIAGLIILLLLFTLAVTLYIWGAKLHSLDRYISTHPIFTICGAIVFTVLIYILLFLVGKFLYGVQDGNVLIGLFTQSQIPMHSVPFSYYMIVSLAGALIFSGVLVSLLTNAVIGRSKRYSTGKLHYRLRNHYVIFGSNSLLNATLDNIRREMVSDGITRQILIVSSKQAAIIRDSLNDFPELKANVIIYNKNLLDPNVMCDIYLQHTRKIVVLGDEEPETSDITNTQLIRNIIDKITGRSKPVYCDVSTYDERYLFAFFAQNKHWQNVISQVVIRPFNYLEMCLSNVWGIGCFNRAVNSHTPYYLYCDNACALIPADNQPFHIIIIGLNDKVNTLLRMIVNLSHYGTDSTQITIITPDNQKYEHLLSEFHAREIKDIRFMRAEENYLLQATSDANELSYYIVADNAVECRFWENYLANVKHAKNILCYAETGIKEHENMRAIYNHQLTYWGFKDISTFINIGRELYAHGKFLYNTQENKEEQYDNLSPLERQVWLNFANYLYNLFMTGNFGIRATSDDVDGRTHNIKELHANVRTEKAINQYCDAQEVLLAGGNSAFDGVRRQLNIIRKSYKDILVEYLNKGSKNDLMLINKKSL